MLSRMLRSANRGGWIPTAAARSVGFRVVQAALPPGVMLPPPDPPPNARRVRPQGPPADSGRHGTTGHGAFLFGPRLGPLYARHKHSPGLAECPNGDKLAVWFSCISEPGPELCNAASRLRLGATAWDPPSPLWDAPDVNDHAPMIWWNGDRTLIHCAEAGGFVDTILRISRDPGCPMDARQGLLSSRRN